MLKKWISLLVGVSLAFAAIGGAAAPAVSTRTTYDVAAGEIAVVTTVTGVSEGEVFTYLATDAADVNALVDETNIAYIDQKTVGADQTTLTFEYSTDDPAWLGKTNVLVGGSQGYASEKNAVNMNAVNYQVNDGAILSVEGVDSAEYVLIQDDIVATGTVNAVSLDGNVVAAEKYFVAANGIYIDAALLKNKVGVAQFIIAVDTFDGTYVNALRSGYIAEDTFEEGEEAAPSVLVLGEVLGAATRYGIEFSSTADFQDGTCFEADALGKGSNGQFAIKLFNYAAAINETTGEAYFAADGAVYARIYAYVDAVKEATSAFLVKDAAVAEEPAESEL